jgi:hypothetical protein
MFPVTLDPGYEGYDVGTNSARGQWGFEFGGALYVFGMEGNANNPPYAGDAKIHALKSLDSGATWTELDAANGPACPIYTSHGQSFTVALDSAASKVAVATLRATVNGSYVLTAQGLAVTFFDLAAGTWGATANHDIPTMGVKYKNSVANATREVMFQLVTRGANDYVLLYSGTPDTNSLGNLDGRAYTATFDGETFGAGTILPNQATDLTYYWPITAVPDPANGRTLLFYLEYPRFLQCVPLLDAGTFGGAQAITENVNISGSTGVVSDALIAEDQVWIAVWDDPSITEMRVYHAPLDTLAWTHSTVTTDATNSLVSVENFAWIGQFVGLGYANGTLMCAWAFTDDVDEDGAVIGHWRYAAAATSDLVWSAPATLFSAPAREFHQDNPSVRGFTAQIVYPFTATDGIGCLMVSLDEGDTLTESAQFELYPVGGTPVASVSVECSITILDVALVQVPIHNVWESGYIRQTGEGPKIARLGNADLWLRGDGPLIHQWKGLDGTPVVTPLLTDGGTVVTDMSASPGVVYQAKNDLKSENFTMRFETNALNAWMEISSFTAFYRPDLYVR